MDPLMSLTAAEAQRDRHNAIMHARRNPEPDTAPKFHVATFRSRAKAIALCEFAYKDNLFFSIESRGAVFTRHAYGKKRIAAVRRRFEAQWRAAQREYAREYATTLKQMER